MDMQIPIYLPEMRGKSRALSAFHPFNQLASNYLLELQITVMREGYHPKWFVKKSTNMHLDTEQSQGYPKSKIGKVEDQEDTTQFCEEVTVPVPS